MLQACYQYLIDGTKLVDWVSPRGKRLVCRNQSCVLCFPAVNIWGTFCLLSSQPNQALPLVVASKLKWVQLVARPLLLIDLCCALIDLFNIRWSNFSTFPSSVGLLCTGLTLIQHFCCHLNSLITCTVSPPKSRAVMNLHNDLPLFWILSAARAVTLNLALRLILCVQWLGRHLLLW